MLSAACSLSNEFPFVLPFVQCRRMETTDTAKAVAWDHPSRWQGISHGHCACCFKSHVLRNGYCWSCERTTVRVELYNRYQGSCLIGNGYLVAAITRDGRRANTIHWFSGDEDTARAFAAWLNAVN